MVKKRGHDFSFDSKHGAGILQAADRLFSVGQFGNGRAFPANRAIFLLLQFYLTEMHGSGVKGEQCAVEGFADPGDKLQGLGRLDGAEHASDRTQHTRLRTGGNSIRWRWLAEKAAITGGPPRKHSHGLAGETQDSAMGKGDFFHDTGIIHQKFGREVVRAFNNKIVAADDVPGIVGAQHFLIGPDREVGIDGEHFSLGRYDLGNIDVLGKMNYLPLEI